MDGAHSTLRQGQGSNNLDFDIKKMVCFTFLMFSVNSFQTTCNVNSNMLFLIWTDYLLQMIRLGERGKWK